MHKGLEVIPLSVGSRPISIKERIDIKEGLTIVTVRFAQLFDIQKSS